MIDWVRTLVGLPVTLSPIQAAIDELPEGVRVRMSSTAGSGTIELVAMLLYAGGLVAAAAIGGEASWWVLLGAGVVSGVIHGLGNLASPWLRLVTLLLLPVLAALGISLVEGWPIRLALIPASALIGFALPVVIANGLRARRAIDLGLFGGGLVPAWLKRPTDGGRADAVLRIYPGDPRGEESLAKDTIAMRMLGYEVSAVSPGAGTPPNVFSTIGDILELAGNRYAQPSMPGGIYALFVKSAVLHAERTGPGF